MTRKTASPKPAAADGAEDLSPTERGRRHLEGGAAPAVWGAPVLWHCGGCEFLWTGHARQIKCPTCGSRNLNVRPPVGAPAPPPVDSGASKPVFTFIETDQIESAPDNPRKHFDQEKLAELAATIREHGILEPLLVRHIDPARRVLAGGERRLRAAKLAGLKIVPCLVRKMTDAQFAEIQLIENLQREDLNPIEEAEAYARITRAGMSQKDLAAKLGIDPSQVSNRIRLLQAPPTAREAVAAGTMGTKQAELLIPWADLKGTGEKLAKRCVKERLTLEEFERALRDELENASRSLKPGAWGGPKFEITEALRAQLDVRKTPRRFGGDEPRAFNVRLWEKLQKAANAAVEARIDPRGEAREAKRSGAAKPAAPKEDPPREFGQKLYEWRCDQLVLRITAALEKASSDRLIFATLLAISDDEMTEARETLCRAFDLGPPFHRVTPTEFARSFVQCKSGAAVDLLRRVLLAEFVGSDGTLLSRWGMMPLIDGLAGLLGVDPIPPARSLDAGFLALWSDRRLEELAARPVFGRIEKGLSRPSLIAALLAHWPDDYVPPELVTVDAAGDFRTTLPSTAKPAKRAKKKAGPK